MQTVFWLLGSMFFLLLIHFLLPIGYTKKGKFVIVVAGGLFAFGGLVSAATLPLWQTILALLALSFLGAYIMDTRLGKIMYMRKEQFILENEIEDNENPLNLTKQTQKTSEIEFIDLAELDVAASSPAKKQDIETISAESLDEENSFLKNREIESDNKEILVDVELNAAFLSDIESLLEGSSDEKVDFQEDKVDLVDEEGWLDELAELSMTKDEENSTPKEPHLDDFELEVLLTDKKIAAASKNDIKSLKELQLQK